MRTPLRIVGEGIAAWRVKRSRLSHSLGRAVHHPGNAELVDAHAKTLGPERLAEGHGDVAAIGERIELALAVRGIRDRERDRKALRLVKMLAWCVGGHQDAAVWQRHPRMHNDLLAAGRGGHLR